MSKNAKEVVLAQTNATGSRGKIGGCYMQEYSTTSTADDWPIIVSENRDGIIETIGPPQIFGAIGEGLTDKAIVAPGNGIITPTIIWV